MPQGHDRIRAQNGEVVFGVVRHLAPSTKKHARFIFAGLHHLQIGSLHENGEPVLLAVPFLHIGIQRDDHVIVLGLSKGTAERLGDADDFVAVRFRPDGLADGIHVGEKLLCQVGSNEDHFRPMLIVRGGEESSLCHVDVTHVGKIRGGAHHVGVFHFDVPAARLHVAVIDGRHGAGGLHGVAQPFVILESDQWAFLRFLEVVHAGDDSKAIDNEDIRTQIRHTVGYI